MKAILMILAALLMGCASVKTERLTEFKELTKDVCLDNPMEVKLAQALYKEMVLNK
jgi:hypothetical protein